VKLTRLVTDPPRRRTPHEWQEQAALLRWAGLHTSQEPRLQWLYAIPNGEARTTRTGGKLERMGLKAGGPDLCLPVPMGWWHGLYLEIKPPRGGASAPSNSGGCWPSMSRATGAWSVTAGWRRRVSCVRTWSVRIWRPPSASGVSVRAQRASFAAPGPA
jgi:hypothetical protein